jgi:methyl-accepting chemotaxis protein
MECEMKNLSRRLLLVLTLLLPAMALVSSASFAATKVEATIFSYDGKDFVRTQTTLREDGQSAANTKLDRDSAAYKALVEKRSYAGVVTLFGHDYQADYAPLTGENGDLTGALFVGVPK